MYLIFWRVTFKAIPCLLPPFPLDCFSTSCWWIVLFVMWYFRICRFVAWIHSLSSWHSKKQSAKHKFNSLIILPWYPFHSSHHRMRMVTTLISKLGFWCEVDNSLLFKPKEWIDDCLYVWIESNINRVKYQSNHQPKSFHPCAIQGKYSNVDNFSCVPYHPLSPSISDSMPVYMWPWTRLIMYVFNTV